MIEKITYFADDGTEFEDENECRDYERAMKFGSIEKDITFWDEHFRKLSIENSELADDAIYVKIDTEKAYDWFNNYLREEMYETLDKCVSHRPKLTGLYFYDSYGDVWKQLEGEFETLYWIAENCGLDKFE